MYHALDALGSCSFLTQRDRKGSNLYCYQFAIYLFLSAEMKYNLFIPPHLPHPLHRTPLHPLPLTSNRYNVNRSLIELQAIVATLSAGPVGIGDGPGFTNVTLVRHIASADGTLLQVCVLLHTDAPLQCARKCTDTCTCTCLNGRECARIRGSS
jgi:hypothetical protein